MKENTQLIVSIYTFPLSHNGQTYLYNTLSNSLLEVDNELYDYIAKHKNESTPLDSTIDEEIVAKLKENLFVTENSKDDFLTYKSIITALRSKSHSINLTITPTMDCCFKCHYCFEKSKRPSYMTEKTMQGITKLIDSIDTMKHLHITWFGGEPLMAIPEMERLYKKLRRKLKGVKISSSIITTGFHLNKINIQSLQRLKISQMQITLDGLKDTHNKIKFTKFCDDVFSHTLKNLDLATEIAPEIHILIRVNLTKTNADEYPELRQMILARYTGKNLSIMPAFVMDRNDCGRSNNPNVFSAKEYPQYILGLGEKGIDSPQLRYPDMNFNECAMRNPYSFAFDSDGNFYKCWEHIGDQKYALGKINKNGVIENVNETLLNRQMYGADPLEDPVCRKCPYLPICCGGCPIQRIENEFEGGKNICCTYYKGHIEEFILEHIRRKEIMEGNHNKQNH